MNTNSSTRVASLTFLLSLACAGSLVACSASDAPNPGEPATSALADSPGESWGVVESAPNATAAPYVLIEESDAGYVLTTLNSGATSTVKALDLAAAGVDAIAMAGALATPETVAARGTIRQDGTFVASALYRALPHPSAMAPGTYYVAHVGPHADSATEVNLGKTRVLHRLDVSGASAPFADQAWISARVLEGSALVAGSIAAGILDARAVFLRVPEVILCAHAIEACPAGEVPTYERGADRCLVPTGCVRHGMCPLYVPACASGYVRSTWPGARGCPSFACDPAFDPAP